MTGTIEQGGQTQVLDPARPIALLEGDWGQVDLGEMSLFFRVGSEAVVIPGGATLATVSTPLLGSLTGALGVHLAVLIGAFLLYDQEPQLTYMPFTERTVTVAMEAPAKPLPEEEMEVEVLTEQAAKAPPKDEGTWGEIKEAEKPKLTKTESKLVKGIRSSAVMLALDRGPIRSVMGDKDSLVKRLEDATNGLDGEYLPAGGGALSTKNHGPGGGGFDPGGAVGGQGNAGNWSGNGRRTKSRLKTRKKSQPTVKPRTPEIAGAFCKPADIQRVVSARANGVKFCYEKALGANPELSGQLGLSWRILPDGSVAKVRVEKSTLGNKEVGNCVARVIQRWKFPKPDGGQCVVRYPFVFNSGI